jgi:hypothetical protein
MCPKKTQKSDKKTKSFGKNKQIFCFSFKTTNLDLENCIEILQTYFRDSTTRLDIVGPSFSREKGANAEELYQFIFKDTVRFFHGCGLKVLGLMSDCCKGNINHIKKKLKVFTVQE